MGDNQPPPPSEGEQRAGRQMDTDTVSFDHYCPRCRVSYPADSTATRATDRQGQPRGRRDTADPRTRPDQTR